MKSQIKLATVFGVELGLHYSWFIIALLITFSLAAQFHATNAGWGNGTIWAAAILTGILFFACLFAHELSHALVAKARGIPIHKITLFLLGGMAQIEGEPSRPSTEFWMGIIGPITSGVIGLILLAIATAFAWRPGATPGTPGLAILVWLGYINLALGAFNMIPGFPLDGGRVLRSIIWGITKDARRSTQIAARVGQIVAVLFIAYGVFNFFCRCCHWSTLDCVHRLVSAPGLQRELSAIADGDGTGWTACPGPDVGRLYHDFAGCSVGSVRTGCAPHRKALLSCGGPRALSRTDNPDRYQIPGTICAAATAGQRCNAIRSPGSFGFAGDARHGSVREDGPRGCKPVACYGRQSSKGHCDARAYPAIIAAPPGVAAIRFTDAGGMNTSD